MFSRRIVSIFLALVATVCAGAPAAGATTGDLVVTADRTLTEDHQGSILVRADGVTLDCAGYRVTGPGFAGVDLRFVTGTKVKNCNVSGFEVGFFLWASPANTLSSNTSTGNQREGFALAASPANDANVLTRNTAAGNGWWGFAVYDENPDTTLSANTATDNGFAGIFVGLGSNRTLMSDNVARSNAVGIDIDSDANTVRGNGAEDNNGPGFLIFQANDNSFSENRSEGNATGFVTGRSSRNSFTGNNARGNRNEGFHFDAAASFNQLTNNVAAENDSNGFGFYSVSDNQLIGNTARNNRNGQGFLLAEGPPGAGSPSRNVLAGNRASGNLDGGGFLLVQARETTLIENSSEGNDQGFIGTSNSSANSFVDNTAIRNRGDGFHLDVGSSSNTLKHNTSRENDGNGFGLYSVSNNTLTGNRSADNRNGHGFLVTEGPAGAGATVGNVLTANSATGNLDGAGFWLTNATLTALTLNRAHNNGHGFVLVASAENKLTKNLAHRNHGLGFGLLQSTTTTLTGNEALGNTTIGFRIFLGSIDNTIQRNIGFGNDIVDAQDDNPRGSNEWSQNHFGATQPSWIE